MWYNRRWTSSRRAIRKAGSSYKKCLQRLEISDPEGCEVGSTGVVISSPALCLVLCSLSGSRNMTKCEAEHLAGGLMTRSSRSLRDAKHTIVHYTILMRVCFSKV